MRQRARTRERVSSMLFTACAGLVILVMAAIFVFVGVNAYQTFTVDHISPAAFLFTAAWLPDSGQAGSLVLIVGSVVVTVVAVLLSTPISVGLAIFVAEIAPPWARNVMRPALELLTGIPSIVYGFLGLLVIVPLIPRVYNALTGGPYLAAGFDTLAAALVLTVMILPTITTIAIDALAALPRGVREASLALGATRWQTIRRTLVPAASSGIFTGVILGMGRAIGETLAVSFVIGANANSFPIRFTSFYPYVQLPPSSTITVQLLFDFAEAAPGSLNYHAIWTLAFILLLISFLLVAASRWVASRGAYREPAQAQGRVTLKRLAAAMTGGRVARWARS